MVPGTDEEQATTYPIPGTGLVLPYTVPVPTKLHWVPGTTLRVDKAYYA